MVTLNAAFRRTGSESREQKLGILQIMAPAFTALPCDDSDLQLTLTGSG
jgi:hypothetical protein